MPARANLAFDDPARNFEIQRPERYERIDSDLISGGFPPPSDQEEPSIGGPMDAA
jgi:hypothetical protein